MENFPRLQAFFEILKNYTLWQRLFNWPSLLKHMAGAWAELVEFSGKAIQLKQDHERMNSDLRVERERITHLNNRLTELNHTLTRTEEQLNGERRLHQVVQAGDQTNITLLQQENQTLREQKSELQNAEELRQKETADQIDRALELQRELQSERVRLRDEQLQKVREYSEKLKKTWSEHQEMVKKKIELICTQHTIEYVEAFPFRGSPDNVVQIAGELIVFDAKSPSSPEDLSNFRNYIRNQCEEAGKYTKHETVRKEVYMVIPSAAAEVLDKSVYATQDYTVYIITPDALEPVLLSLRRIADYAFAEEIGPEERQAIVRVIGQLVYAAKRRIQVDQFFSGEVMSILRTALAGIPEELRKEIREIELVSKLNPTMDKRTKEISLDGLEETRGQQQAEAEFLGAPVPERIEFSAKAVLQA